MTSFNFEQTVPEYLYIGDSFNLFWTPLPELVPTSGYSAALLFNGPASPSVNAVVDGSRYKFVITTAISDALLVGYYKAIVQITKSGEKHSFVVGMLEVKPSLPDVEFKNIDQRSFNKRMLDAIEAWMEHKATNYQIDIIRSEVQDRDIERIPHMELVKLRDYYKKMVDAENGCCKEYLFTL